MSRSRCAPLTTTLFLGDLSVLCNEIHVRELFSRYGELERVQLKKSDRDPHRAHLGFGFVKFSSRVSAERALEELNGYFFMGRALRVGWADDYNRVGGEVKARDPKKNRETAQLHVSFVCEDSCRMVSEMELGLVFGVFGNVVDIAIKKNVLNKVSGVQSGYAFVHFALTLGGLESAFNAAERVNERTIDGIRYKCKTDQALLMQYMSLKCRVPEPCNAKPALAEVDRDNHCVDRTYETVSPLFPHMLHSSTYGSTVEAEKVYSSPISSVGRKFLPRRSQQYFDKSAMCNEPVLAARSFLSMKESDFRQPHEVISSSLFSICYNENPSFFYG